MRRVPRFLRVDCNEPVPLPEPTRPENCHRWEPKSVAAVNAALAAGRPLLLRGEPGTGKSQLARAAAVGLGRQLLVQVVDSRVEARDLLWRFDAVARLAAAQLAATLQIEQRADLGVRLDEAVFVEPGKLWWALDWVSARDHVNHCRKMGGPRMSVPSLENDAGWKHGCVVLIDEIDKADPDVANGLLEVLGSQQFEPPGGPRVFAGGANREPSVAAAPAPLIILTSNEERTLPDAFVRRCLVHELQLPKTKALFVERLAAIGADHFPSTKKEVRERAAELLFTQREEAHRLNVAKPGQAEYLDYLRVYRECESSAGLLEQVEEYLAQFCFQKHRPQAEKNEDDPSALAT